MIRMVLLLGALLLPVAAKAQPCTDKETREHSCVGTTPPTLVGKPWSAKGRCYQDLSNGAFTSVACPEEPSWHLLTQSHGGAVSLIKGLTKSECDIALNKLRMTPPHTPPHLVGSGEIDSAECFQ